MHRTGNKICLTRPTNETVTSIVDVKFSQSLVNNVFLPLSWVSYVRIVRRPRLLTSTGKRVHIERIVPIFALIEGHCVRPWFMRSKGLTWDCYQGHTSSVGALERSCRQNREWSHGHCTLLLVCSYEQKWIHYMQTYSSSTRMDSTWKKRKTTFCVVWHFKSQSSWHAGSNPNFHSKIRSNVSQNPWSPRGGTLFIGLDGNQETGMSDLFYIST